MKYKLFICICLILFTISISSVSAMENNTQLPIDEDGGLITSDANNLGIPADNEIISADVQGSFSDLRRAISSSDQITLTGDVTCLSGDEDVYINGGRNVEINGNGHTINANDLRRAFVINPGGSLTLSNLKIINANCFKSTYQASHEGGAIINLGSLTINNCVFENNYGKTGGAIGASMGASTNLYGTNTFSNNRATNDGGAISNNAGSTLIINGKNTFNGNLANNKDNSGKAGAILNVFSNSHAIIKGEAIFTNNQAALDGGAIFNHLAIFEIDAITTFTNNRATGSNSDPVGKGGAIANEDATFNLAGKATFTSNHAGRGGAIDNSLSSQFVLSGDNVFKNNVADISGGAIANEKATSFTSSANNNFDSNRAISGGAFHSYLTPISFSGKNVFYKNTASTSGGAMHIGDSQSISLSGHSYFYDNSATGDGGSGGAIFAVKSSVLDLRGHVFLRNYAGHAGGAVFVNENPFSASHNIFIDNDARNSGDDVEIFNSNVGSFEMNYWGAQSKPSQDKLHNYNVNNIRSWVILQSIIPDEIKQNQEVNLVRFASNSNGDVGGEMGDFDISATPNFETLTIHKNIGSSKYVGKTLGPMTVYLSGPNFNANKMVNVVEGKLKTSLNGNNIVLKEPVLAVNYEVTLTDANGKALSGKTVTIDVNGYKNPRITDSQGKASLILSNLKNGYYNIVSSYDGETNYYASSVTNCAICMFDNESTTNIVGKDFEMYYKDGSKYAVTVTDANNNPITSKDVKFIINSVVYTRPTDSEGKASITLNIDPGKLTITAVYPGDNKNEFAFTENTVTIKSTIESKDIVKYFRNGTQYYAKFLDSKGNPLKNTNVTFNINGVFYTRTTDANGYARMNINLNPGKYIITATHPNGESRGNQITVLSILEGNDLVKYYKNDSQYYIKVLNDDGTPAKAGETVKFNINGVFYTKTTDANGYAKMNINLNPGDYTITAEYKGLQYSNHIKVLPILTGEDLTMKYKDGHRFQAKLVDGQGKALSDKTIRFNVNGVFYNRITDNQGYASLTINLMPGEYIITSEYETAITSNKIHISA
ncbi:hypothetical protein [Methanobrevibacter sp.]|uniref:hypothetical protein n=1 Tax=Methanobrevibacter sp. TaxID=66852 RepID=UPI00388F0331